MAVATAGKTRDAMIQDLRDFAEALKSTETTAAQLQSLDKAAEVVALFENRTVDGEPLDRMWQDEVPAPPRRRGSGGGMEQANSFNRFASKWAFERTGLRASRLGNFRRAYEVSLHLGARTNVETTTINSLRPLNYFLREASESEIPKVWKAASQLARDDGRETPAESHVKKALSDWKKKNVPKSAAAVSRPKGNRAKVDALKTDVLRWGRQEPTLTMPMLREALATLEAEVAAVPPVEEWSTR